MKTVECSCSGSKIFYDEELVKEAETPKSDVAAAPPGDGPSTVEEGVNISCGWITLKKMYYGWMTTSLW